MAHNECNRDLKAHGSLSRDWVSYELNAPRASDHIPQILVENLSELSFEANTTTFTAEGQLELHVFLTQREQGLSRT